MAAVLKPLAVAAATALALLSTLTVGAGSAGAAQPVPRFEPTDCPTSQPSRGSLPDNARCGVLVVPETRAQPNGRTIRVLVATIPAKTSPPKGEPVLYLAGGPGGFPFGEAATLIGLGFNNDRDLILISQRGTLNSPVDPAPTCPEIDRSAQTSLGLPLDGPEAVRLTVDAARACYQRLTAAGTNLAAYNTTENAADVADLRVAMGIPEWNLYGTSYGTNLAMTVMRQHPQGIRSVTLDSAEPPEVVTVGSFAPNARQGLTNLFTACEAQRQCWRRHPGIEQTFKQLVSRLERNPVAAWVDPPGGGPQVKVVIDGGRLVNWLIDEAFHTEDYPSIPAYIADLADGNPAPIATKVAAQIIGSGTGILGYGLALGVTCAEWLPYQQGSILKEGRRAFPSYPVSVLDRALHVTYAPDMCPVWPVPKAPAAQRAATSSTIPTLLLNGSFDGITPTSWARIGARTLLNSTVLEFPGVGHFVVGSSRCGQEVFASFLENPSSPNTACVANVKPAPFIPAATG